ncbi:hypothetical protein CXG81DRAFT_17794, partial [Caulochytrium protostelioides]
MPLLHVLLGGLLLPYAVMGAMTLVTDYTTVANTSFYKMAPACGLCPKIEVTQETYTTSANPSWTSLNLDCSGTGQTAVDYLFIIDMSKSMKLYASGLLAINSFISDIAANGPTDPLFSVVVFGGPPRLIMAPSSDTTLLTNAFTYATTSSNVASGHEAVLEAIRISLGSNPMSPSAGFAAACLTGGACSFSWRAGATRSIIALTDEDSDLPTLPANRNAKQLSGGMTSLCSMLTSTSYAGFCSDTAAIEPSWDGPKQLWRGSIYTEDDRTTPNSKQIFRSGPERCSLSAAYQEEVLQTARMIVRGNAMVTLLMLPWKSNNPYQPRSQWDDDNPVFLLGDSDPVQDDNTAVWQFGHPDYAVMQNEFSAMVYNKDASIGEHWRHNLSGSLTALVLSGGGYARTLDMETYMETSSNAQIAWKAIAKIPRQ